MYDVIAKSLVFGTRNLDKVTNVTTNDQGRIFATAGQFTNAAKAISNLDNSVGKGASAAINAMGKVAEGNKALNAVAKGVNWASKNVNPLLIGAAGYRVFKADNKMDALRKEAYGMSAMFGVEYAMNSLFKTQGWAQLLDKIPGSKGKVIGKIAQGLLFVCGSIAGSTLGYKIGDSMNKTVKNIQDGLKDSNTNNNSTKEIIA